MSRVVIPVPELVMRYGASGKLVRAICAQCGWRWTPNGAPAAWYSAWQEGLGLEIKAALRGALG